MLCNSVTSLWFFDGSCSLLKKKWSHKFLSCWLSSCNPVPMQNCLLLKLCYPVKYCKSSPLISLCHAKTFPRYCLLDFSFNWQALVCFRFPESGKVCLKSKTRILEPESCTAHAKNFFEIKGENLAGLKGDITANPVLFSAQ